MGISIRSHLYSNAVIAAKFCTWHDSCAVVACAKICCDLMASNRVMARRNFHRIWIAGKKPLLKRAPGVRYHHCVPSSWHNGRDHSEYGLSLWETTLYCNVISHWLRQYPKHKHHYTDYKVRHFSLTMSPAMILCNFFRPNDVIRYDQLNLAVLREQFFFWQSLHEFSYSFSRNH